MRALIQEVRDADESWVGHDPEAAGRYWAARGALDAACHPSTIDDYGLDAALRAIDDERRQTQRRMIAALYWRAGAIRLACHTHPYASPMWWGSIADSDAILAEAVRMEDACVR